MTPDPEPLARVADLMSTFRARWFLCGGWAVDAWLGGQTRDHPDVDIAVFQDDQRAIFDHLAGWQLIAHDPNVAGDTSEPWDGRRLDLPAHVHARSPDVCPANPETGRGPGFNLEVLLNERSGRDWVFSREPRVRMPLRLCARQSAWGLPTVVPEVLLFYKATAYFGEELQDRRPHDEADFRDLLPHLTDKRRQWLWESISLVHPGHPWLTQLSG
jgi:hypothetical protein